MRRKTSRRKTNRSIRSRPLPALHSRTNDRSKEPKPREGSPFLVVAVVVSVIDMNIDFGEAFQYYKLRIVHTSGLLSAIDPVDNKNVRCTNKQDLAGCLGGLTRVAGFVNQLRRSGHRVLLLDGGNILARNIWYHIYHGLEMSTFMGTIQYDAMVLGCNDFDLMRNFLGNTSVPVLFSNIDTANSPPEISTKVRTDPLILTIQSTKVAIMGYTGRCPVFDEMGIQIFGLDKLEQSILTLQGLEDVGIIILISHATQAENLKIARAYEAIDIIVAGGERASDRAYPVVNMWKSRISANLIIQGDDYARNIGSIEVEFAERGRIVFWRGTRVLMHSNITKDPRIESMYDTLMEPIYRMYTTYVGRSTDHLEGADKICQQKECLLGSYVCDAVVDQAAASGSRCRTCILMGYSIGNSIKPGDVSRYDIFMSLPMNQSFSAVTLNGSTLIKLFEDSVKKFESGPSVETFFQVSGLKIHYNYKHGKFVEKVSVALCHNCATYKEATPNKEVCVMMSDLVWDRQEFTWLNESILNASLTKISEMETVLRYFEKYSPVHVRMRRRMTGLDTFPKFQSHHGHHGTARLPTTNVLLLIQSVFVSSISNLAWT